jgi:hypothetical protein
MSAEAPTKALPRDETREPADAEFYCPRCASPVANPLSCGDCGSLICRICGTPLERIDDLGIG